MKFSFTINVFVLVFILILFSSAQINWEKYEGNPVLNSGTADWESSSVSFPFVRKEGDIWKMWYNGQNASYTRIGYATSNDGISWTKYASNPVMGVGTAGSWDDEGVFNPQIIFDGSVYHMWYGGWDGTLRASPPWIGNGRWGYATSNDGINWTKADSINPVLGLGNPGEWDADGLYGSSIMYIDSLFHCWYGGLNGINGRIGHATSVDGKHWQRDTLNNPVLDIGAAGEWDALYVFMPYVLYNADSARYEMAYTGGTDHEATHIGFATSADGKIWTKNPNNPVLRPGPELWDGGSVWSPNFLIENAMYKMWFSGNGSNVNYRIGYATAPVGPTAVKDKIINTPVEYTLNQNYPNPFNPKTTISYQLPKFSEVELSIYSILGQKVATLVNKKQPAGTYNVQWDASGFASGIYIYQLKAGGQKQNAVLTKKLILLK